MGAQAVCVCMLSLCVRNIGDGESSAMRAMNV